MGFLDTANQKLAELQQRTGDFMTVQKLNSQRRTLKRDLERMYTVIGETCCRMHAEGGDPEALNAMFTEVEVLKEKNMVADNLGRLKVLASGSLDKALTVEADAFSVQAIKMITLTGGHAVKLRNVGDTKAEDAEDDKNSVQ